MIGFEEREADEEAGAETQHYFGDHVIWHPPVLLEHSGEDDWHLLDERHRKLSLFPGVGSLIWVVYRLILFALVNPINFVLYTRGLGTSIPKIEPRLAFWVGACVDNFEHVLGRVLVIGTSTGTVILEVVEESARVVANGPEVDSLATSGQEEQLIKLFKQNGAGLMNGAQDCLAGIGELA